MTNTKPFFNTLFVSIMLINLFHVSERFLGEMLHLQSAGFTQSATSELGELYGSESKFGLDGKVSRETLFAKVLSGDVATIANVRSACQSPTDDIKNICNTLLATI